MIEPRTYARPRRLRRQRAWQKQARDRARLAGICTTCITRPVEPGKCRCLACNQARRPLTQKAPAQ